jgi:hypothetical protein
MIANIAGAILIVIIVAGTYVTEANACSEMGACMLGW